jgi:murein L,D-transpeptidase YcbB/YkuD
MLRVLSLAACISLAATVAIIGSLPASAQSVQGKDSPPKMATAPQLPSAQPPAEATPPPLPSAPPSAEATSPPPPVVELDPLVAQVRQQLGSIRGNVAAADRAAVTAFYGERTALLWVTTEGLTARARHAMAEIAKADDWGLSAKAFELPADSGDRSLAALADAEIKLTLAALRYARHARGGRLEPSQLSRNFDQSPPVRDPKAVLEALAATETPGTYLRELHPRHPQFALLRQALLRVRAGAEADRQEDKAERIVRLPDGPTLKLGMEHPDVRLLRARLKLSAPPPGGEELYDRDVQQAVAAFQRKSGIQASGQLTPRTRAALNTVETSRPAFGSEEQRLIVNMERWRWMPEEMGEFHVWDNVPEYQARVVKKGRVIHQSKIIVGKPETQTAIFSANMRYVIFGPEWGVPNSIKIKEILPYLRPSFDSGGLFGFGGYTDTRILEKHNLRVSLNGRPVDASQIDWGQVDITKFNFIQPAGPGNVLGAVKFRFPNKHDIYMHDTPQRELFERTTRTFSHGCIRVHNPGRLAEVLLEEDKGWSAARVKEHMSQGAQGVSYEVTLTKQIPVHITYFTMIVGEDGQMRSFADIYGHDARVSAALAGRPMPLEPAAVATKQPKRDAKEARRPRPYAQSNDFFTGLFGN